MAIATTLPASSIVATVSSLDSHVTDLSVAVSGKTVALRSRVSPTFNDHVVMLSVIDSAGVADTGV